MLCNNPVEGHLPETQNKKRISGIFVIEGGPVLLKNLRTVVVSKFVIEKV